MSMEKHVLVKKMFTIGLNMGLSIQARVEKDIHRVKTHRLTSKEKFLGTAFSKEGCADRLLRHERTHHN